MPSWYREFGQRGSLVKETDSSTCWFLWWCHQWLLQQPPYQEREHGQRHQRWCASRFYSPPARTEGTENAMLLTTDSRRLCMIQKPREKHEDHTRYGGKVTPPLPQLYTDKDLARAASTINSGLRKEPFNRSKDPDLQGSAPPQQKGGHRARAREEAGEVQVRPPATAMKTNFVLRSEHQNCCGSSAGPRRSVLCCASENANAESFDSARYLSRYKASGKIHKAASQGDVGKVQRKLLGGKNDVNARDKKNRSEGLGVRNFSFHRTALHYACAYGHPNIVVLLIEKKCEVNIRDSDNSTALIKASQCQHEECVTLLLKYGADPNVRDASGNTAIHYTIYTDNVPIAAKLLAYNASIELQTKDGFTPLLLALKENKEQMAEFLIENKANIHAVDELNRSTLMYAVQCESKHMVKFLLQQGVDVFLKDAFGWSASSYALYGHCEVIKRTLSKYEEKILRCIPRNNPDSSVSESCGPGFRKSPQEGKSSCYFPCTPCPENEISSGTDAGDSPNLVDLLYSCDRLIQCKISRCALLSRKVKIMEHKIRRPQEELLEIEEVKSQLEDENSELDEICHIRILLQQEDLKKDNADQYFGNTETVLREKGNHNDAEEIGQLAMYAKMLYIEISRINYHFKQVN
ncbi:POTE ankyrin domain family member A [Dipodomys spectabilis]|uniref:POTE ankyrin domain family member A n=1 Tax=Dipodomys spectabilis TaxID=105255 RepID=UPI001C5470D2|nr:POTE ankyrin domain family member A [Dipodomys spectabilis]